MATWSSQRKTHYLLIISIFLIIVITGVYFIFFYHKPTCFDQIMNGDEGGIDCGGSCSRLCQSAFLPPRIEWGGAKYEKVTDGLYNVAAYLVNPNVNGGATDVPYRMRLFDESGSVIGERQGKINLYPHRNSLAFQAQIKTNMQVPTKATFEFMQAPVWFKAEDKLNDIAIIDKKYEEDEEGSRLNVTLENRSLFDYKNILVGVVLYDSSGNVAGFSQTVVDSIPANKGREIAPYTWPINRNGKVISEDVILSTKPVPAKN